MVQHSAILYAQGSQKLLHWSAHHVEEWVRAIELDAYVEGLENAGIHGAVMVGLD